MGECFITEISSLLYTGTKLETWLGLFLSFFFFKEKKKDRKYYLKDFILFYFFGKSRSFFHPPPCLPPQSLAQLLMGKRMYIKSISRLSFLLKKRVRVNSRNLWRNKNDISSRAVGIFHVKVSIQRQLIAFGDF